MNKEGMECPECHYAGYKYYVERDPPQTIDGIPVYDCREVPVVIKTPLGYLCRLCRYEWKENGTSVAQEGIDQLAVSFRKWGKDHTKTHGSKEVENRNKGFIPR